MCMDVDIEIYLKKLKDFFNNDEEARIDMFGQSEVDMDKFYLMVADKATMNNKKNGHPVLSPTEMLEIITDLALKDIEGEIEVKNFVKRQQEIEKVFMYSKHGFPPIGLN